MASIRSLSLIAVAALATSGCALFPRGETTARAMVMPGQIEPIHAAAITRDLAVFWVSSNGCTKREDLTPIVDRAGDGSTITLRRIDEDRCNRPMVDGVEVRWTFEELGLTPGSRVQVNNPYQLPPSI